MDHQTVIDITRRWIAEVVIGLNLCPFARRVFRSELIRYVVTDAADEESLLVALQRELELLVASPMSEIETTLLIHPHALGDFLDYNDFTGETDRLLQKLRLRGTIQIATFHPGYQFAGTTPEAVENYTNRSPFPMLHLLREESITAVASDADELLAIPERNIETLKTLGREKVLEMLRDINS